MNARKNAAVLGFNASTTTPSRNARFAPIGADRLGHPVACLAERSDAEPDQIERADQLEQRNSCALARMMAETPSAPPTTCTSPPSAVPKVDAMPACLPPDSVLAKT